MGNINNTILFKIGMIGLIAILHGCGAKSSASDEQSEYVGRYALKSDLVLEVKEEGELLTLLLSFWTTAQILDPVGKDKFMSLLHPQMQFEFKRDSIGKIFSLTSIHNLSP